MALHLVETYEAGDDTFDPNDLLQVLGALTGQSCPFEDATRERVGQMPTPPTSLTRTQLNSLLLWYGCDRMEEPFFRLFFRQGSTPSLEPLEWSRILLGVHNFRVLALLRWGNIKFGYKRWSSATHEQIERDLISFAKPNVNGYTERAEELKCIDPIPLEKTWLTGYLAADSSHDDLESVREKGKTNFARYLLYEYMDVYVATSMRDPDDFWHVGTLVNRLQEHEDIGDLHLRIYDPTQAFEAGRAAKGLQEALMLLRCRCCIYCAQLSDSFGKDSELASVLAQGKPVIVWAPSYQELETEFSQLPDLSKRGGCELSDILRKKVERPDVKDTQTKQLVESGRLGQDLSTMAFADEPDALSLNERVELMRKLDGFDEGERLGLARNLEALAYSKRDGTLRGLHPLALQVNIESGVANGVLIARSLDECARLVRQICLREMEFSIGEVDGGEPDGTVGLYEKGTRCLFRISTGDELLSNTFWNFHKEELERPSARRAPSDLRG